jgi:ClpP class serine protease
MTNRPPLVHVAQHMLNRPLAVTERHAPVVLSAIRSRLNLNLIYDVEGHPLDAGAMDHIAAAGRNAYDIRSERRSESKIFTEDQGVAIIPITGTLTRTWGLDPYSGMTGYDGIKAKLIAALEDDSIDAILLDIDSPGGAVSGCFDLADLIFASNETNGGKLIWSIANEQMCSAALALGCSADRVFVPRTGEVGSVGVIWVYFNEQESLTQDGIQVRVFRNRKSPRKAEGNPYEQMSEEAEARIFDELDEMFEFFVETVARGRGMSKKSVRDTQGLTYMGRHARDVKFATDVASDDQVWAQLMQRLGR